MSKTDSKKNYWKDIFSKEAAAQEAASYAELAFWGRTKNILMAFFVAVSLLTFLLSLFGGIENFKFDDVFVDLIVYAVLLPFIFFNHRWAMISAFVIYAAGKVILIGEGIGTPISHMIFVGIVLGLTFKSSLVASYLRKNSKRSVG